MARHCICPRLHSAALYYHVAVDLYPGLTVPELRKDAEIPAGSPRAGAAARHDALAPCLLSRVSCVAIAGVGDGRDDGSHHPTCSAMKREDNISRSSAWRVDRAIVFASGPLWVRSLNEMPQSP
jgi:hypothetical protein